MVTDDNSGGVIFGLMVLRVTRNGFSEKGPGVVIQNPAALISSRFSTATGLSDVKSDNRSSEVYQCRIAAPSRKSMPVNYL